MRSRTQVLRPALAHIVIHIWCAERCGAWLDRGFDGFFILKRRINQALGARCTLFMQSGNTYIKQGTCMAFRGLLTFLSTKLVQKNKACPHDPSTAGRRQTAVNSLSGKMFFRIKALWGCCAPCAQSYPHIVCKSGGWGQVNKIAGI